VPRLPRRGARWWPRTLPSASAPGRGTACAASSVASRDLSLKGRLSESSWPRTLRSARHWSSPLTLHRARRHEGGTTTFWAFLIFDELRPGLTRPSELHPRGRRLLRTGRATLLSLRARSGHRARQRPPAKLVAETALAVSSIAEPTAQFPGLDGGVGEAKGPPTCAGKRAASTNSDCNARQRLRSCSALA
jgi:hypothetical protein